MSLIGLQLYTVKAEFEKDPLGTLAGAARMGYDGVEFYGSYGGAPICEIKAELDRDGLKTAGCVVDMEKLTNGAALLKCIEDCRVLGTNVIVCPWLNDEHRDSAESCRRTARVLNDTGKTCLEHGIVFMYHVHGYEFKDFGGTTLMKILIEETDPKYFNLEVDVFWVEDGGLDALQFLKDHWDRTKYIHLKDMRDRETKHDIEVGDGVIDIRGIIALAVKKDCPWLIVEQEMFEMPTMASAEKSCQNVNRILAEMR